MADNRTIGIEPCACGHACCQAYWLTDIGSFCTGSGFTREEAEELARRWNAHAKLLAALKTARVTIKALHGPTAWDIYERASPEMKQIDAALAAVEQKDGHTATGPAP